MLLQEINTQEAPHYELASIVKFFPNKYKTIIHQQAGKPHKLKYQGLDLFDEDGDGPALDGAVHEVKRQVSAGDIRMGYRLPTPLGASFEYEAPIREAQRVWTAYNPHNNTLLLGFDAWIDEEDFNTHWDKFFEEHTGEEFDYDNDEHERIFSQVHRNFMKIGFYGLLFEVTINHRLKVEAELLSYSDGGFFKGTLNDPYVKSLGFIEL